jgi:uncharacterized protein (TIGR02099 family)
VTHIHLPHAIHLSSRPLRRLVRFLFAAVAVMLVLFALAFSALRVALPHMNNYREEVQAVLSKAWGAPVQLGSIDVAFVSYRPQLVLTDLRLGKDGPTISRFGVSLALWRSVFARRWVAGKIVIDKPHLAFVEQPDGKWILSGAPQTSPQDDPDKKTNSWSDWLDRLPDLGDVSIHDADVEWLRPATAKIPESHQTINLNATARLAAHGWSISGELFAPGFGSAPVRLRADGHLGDESGAEVYLSTNAWSLPAMQQAIRDFTHGAIRAELGGCAEYVEGVDCSAGMPLVNQGELTGALWLRFEGTSLHSVSADFDISTLKVSRMAKIAGVGALAATRSQADLNRIGGRMIWQKTADGWRLDADQVSVVTADDVKWPIHSVHMIHAGNQTDYASDYVDLHQLAVWLATAPLPKSILELLGQNVLRGDAQDIRLHLVGDTLESGYLELQHFGNVPGRRLWPVIGQADGLGGLDLKLYKQPSGWLARFDQSHLVLAVPGMFREPMTIDSLKGDVYLHDAGSSSLLVYSPGLRIKNADLFTDTGFRYRAAGEDNPAQLSIDSEFGDIHVARVPAYLPRNLLDKHVLQWLDTNLVPSGQTGRVDRGHFIFNGDPHRFPFIHGGGWFSVVFDFKQLNLPFLPHWPEVKDAQGNIAFVNQQFHATIDQGQLADVPIDGSRVSIFDLNKAALDIAVSTKAPLSKLLGFVGQTPLLDEGSLNALKVTGQAGLDVSVKVRLDKKAKTAVNGHLTLKNNTLNLNNTPIKLERISGAVDFHNADFSAKNVSARFDDEPATIGIKPGESADSTLVSLQTRLDPLFALRDKSAPALHPLLDRVSGKAETMVTLSIPHHGNRFGVQATSDLAGVSSRLPPPFGKASDAAWPLNADLVFTGGVLRQLTLKARGGVPWQASLGFNDRGDLSGGGVSNRSENTDRSLNNSAILAINLNTPQLDWDAWQSILGSAPPSRSELAASNASVAPFNLNVQTGQLTVAGMHFGQTRLNVRFSGEQYLIQSRGDDLDGNLKYQPPGPSHPAGHVAAQFKRFHVEEPSSSDSASSGIVAPVTSWDLKHVPGTQVIIDDLRIGKHRLGKLVLNAEAAAPGSDRIEIPTIDWQPKPDFRLIGQGEITGQGAKQETQLNVSAQGTDVGGLFKQVVGENSPMTGGEVKTTELQLSWPGSPAAFAAERLNGVGDFELQHGQLNDVDPGAGRLAGLLSLGAIRRRLRLDFSDVVDQGLPFDSLTAHLKLKQGVLSVEPMTLRNASMHLTATGETRLNDSSLDYTVKVYADIGMLLPIIGTVAGGPIVGGAVLALQQAIKTIDKNPAPTVVYRVTGTISEPVVKTIDANPERSIP